MFQNPNYYRANKDKKDVFFIAGLNIRFFIYKYVLAFPRGPGGFRKLREACRNHFHLSWYLSDAVVTRYCQKP